MERLVALALGLTLLLHLSEKLSELVVVQQIIGLAASVPTSLLLVRGLEVLVEL